MEARHMYAYELARDLAAEDARVLEIGHGEGYGAELVSGSVAGYDGVEIDPAAVEHARARYGSDRVRFHHITDHRLPFPDARFDLAFSFQVIEHVADPAPLLEEIARVCRPGAAVVFTTPNRRVRLNPGQRPWNRYHVEEYDAASLQALLAPHFSSVEVHGIYGDELMETTERKRIDRMRKIARLDPLGLRYRLPENVVMRLGALVRGGTHREQTDAGFEPVSFGEITHSAERALSACDLVAFARR